MKTNRVYALVAAPLFSLIAFAGCVAETSDDADSDEVEVSEGELSKSANFGYFRVTRRDMRKCITPICGGYFVQRVNEAKTRCADGSLQDECYVSAIQLTGTGLSSREQDEFRAELESGKALIKARTFKKKFNGNYYGTLKANEAWLGATGSTPEGTFYRAADNGIRCITAPCPSTGVTMLNGNVEQNVIDVRLDNTEITASEDALNAASNALGTEQGILLAGGIALPKCVEGSVCGPFVTATEFYLRVERREGKSCGGFRVGGPTTCNAGQFCKYSLGDICGAADAPGTCAYKPEICPAIHKPVCGCDGASYGNACRAAAAGVSVARTGECPEP